MRAPFLLLLTVLAPLGAQGPDLSITISRDTARIPLAVPDFRGVEAAQPLMAAFNETLWNDLDESDLVALKPKTQYPVSIPQQPDGWNPREWSAPPVSADYAAIGYAAVQADRLVLRGWLIDVRQATPAAGSVFGSFYQAAPGADGARRNAHEFAADIIRHLGGNPVLGTKIYFTSDRLGQWNVWAMDPDGANQHAVTSLSSRNGPAAMSPAISADGGNLALMTYAEFFPKIYVFALEPFHRLPFSNPDERLRATPAFTPDGKRLVYSLADQIYIADLDGARPRRISASTATSDIEPRVNPKTGAEIAFVSGRAGHAHLYTMNADGGDVTPLTTGEGEAVNPSWHPKGQLLAYAGNQGYVPGHRHIFVMDVATRKIVAEIPNDGDLDENPVWAPDGLHLVFMRTRNRVEQIWTVLADGTRQHQLTTAGHNKTPVWSLR
jgi:TolB protein